MKKEAFIITFLLITAFVKGQSQDISFNSGQFTLNGSIVIPNTGSFEYPVVIFIHGSGPMDRDVTIPLTDQNSSCLFPDLYGDTIRIFKEISEHLNQKGIASFRYDKRTFTHRKDLNIKEASPYEFIADAISAVNYVKDQEGIDEDNVFILGHSQGTNFLPYIAEQCQVKGLINLACLARPIDSLYAEQIKYIFNTCVDSSQAETYYKQYLDIFSKIRNDAWDNDIPIDGVYPKFWKEWISITDSTLMKYQGISKKVLFLQGTDDFNVPPMNGEIILNTLPDNANVIFFPGLNHFFTTSTDAHIAPSVLDSISGWIGQEITTTHVSKYKHRVKLSVTNFNDRIEINLPNNEKIVQAFVYDLNGRLVEIFTSEHSLHIKKICKGQKFFIIKIESNQSIFIEKLIL